MTITNVISEPPLPLPPPPLPVTFGYSPLASRRCCPHSAMPIAACPLPTWILRHIQNTGTSRGSEPAAHTFRAGALIPVVGCYLRRWTHYWPAVDIFHNDALAYRRRHYARIYRATTAAINAAYRGVCAACLRRSRWHSRAYQLPDGLATLRCRTPPPSRAWYRRDDLVLIRSNVPPNRASASAFPFALRWRERINLLNAHHTSVP